MPPPAHLAYMKPIPILPSANVDRTIDFYTLLGFKVGGKHPGFVSLWIGDKACVNLYFREGTDLGKGECIVLSEVGQARLLFDHLQKHKPPLTQLVYAPGGGEKCEAKPWGFEQFSLLDPDGNKITFASHLTDDEDEPQVQAPAVPEV